MEVRPLPSHPNLEHYKSQAKDLLKACLRSDDGAIRTWTERWFATYSGVWVETEARLRGAVVTQELIESIRLELVDRIEINIRKSKLCKPGAKLADAQVFIAREHGFESWPKFVKQVQGLERRDSPDANFESAADAIVSGDAGKLSQLLRDNPELVRMRSQRAHHAALLHYVAANGVEDFRQKTPDNIVEITKLLLDAGADVNAESKAYGGSTALGLVATSVHPERAGVQEAIMQLLLEHGAVIDKLDISGNRGSAVEACLMNGRGNAARFLSLHGAILNLATGAGVGAVDVVKGFFREDGTLGPNATKEQLQRGFLWACMYGHREVVAFLLDHGADLRDQDDLGGTGLHWAAGGAHLHIIDLLIKRGAPLEERNRWNGTVLEYAGWSFANGDSNRDYAPVFEALLAAGAKLQDGWLAWLERQKGHSAAAKARIANVLRAHGATT